MRSRARRDSACPGTKKIKIFGDLSHRKKIQPEILSVFMCVVKWSGKTLKR